MSYFPTAPLPVRAFIAPGYDPVSPTSWTWTEITSDVRWRSGITIEAGRRDEASTADPSKCTLTLNNRSGNYSTRNALGTYYGQLRRNTPLQVRVDRQDDTFTRSSASGWGTSDAGFAWSHTSTSSWTVDGSQGVITHASANLAAQAVTTTGGAQEVDVEYVASIAARTTGANWVSAAIVRYTDASNFYLLAIEFATDNTIKVSAHKFVAGVFTTLQSATATGISYNTNTKIRVRAVAVGENLQVKAWLDGTSEPADWNLQTQDTSLTGAGVGLYQWRVTGNTNVGSLAVKIDEYTTSAILFTGLVSEWPVRWDKVGRDCYVTVTANGVLRRLQQGAAPLRSPLYRQLVAQNPAGYWPCEDESGATQASSPLSGPRQASVVDVTFAADDTLAGAAPVLKVNSASSRIAGTVVASPTTADGYAGMLLVKLGSVPGSATNIIEWFGRGTVYRWVIDADGTAFGVTGYAGDGSVVVARTSAVFVVDPTEWVALQLETEEDGGGNVDWQLIWNASGSTVFWTFGGSYAGTADALSSFRVTSPIPDTAYAHIWAGDNDLPFVTDTFSLVSSGYSGETATARIARLCDEEGIAVFVEPSTTSAEALGAQDIDTIVNLLRAAEVADQGILYERGGGLAYRPRAVRYNQAVNIALDVDSGHLAEPPEPTDDDQRIRNDVTVQRDGGGQGRYVDTTSVEQVGTYAEQVTLSLSADSRCDDQASWRVYLGTLPELRWPLLELNFGRQPELIDDWLATGIGARVTVANQPDQLIGEEIDLIVEGYSTTLRPDGWTLALTCSPAAAWQVGTLGTTAVDTAGSELTSSITSSATSISVTVTDGPLWSTAGTDFDIVIGGERMTCTAISGASSPQTFTVTRAVNGVVKAHDAGAAVHPYRPLVAAL